MRLGFFSLDGLGGLHDGRFLAGPGGLSTAGQNGGWQGLKSWLMSVSSDHRFSKCGEVAEWSIASHSKCEVRASVPGVRIPPSPPIIIGPFQRKHCTIKTRGETPGPDCPFLRDQLTVFQVATQERSFRQKG